MSDRPSLIFKVAVACSVLMVLGHSYHILNRSSDGTLWTGIPSRLYVTQSIRPSSNVGSSQTELLQIGDLLLNINGQDAKNVEQIANILQRHTINDKLNLLIFRPAIDDKLEIQLTRSQLQNDFVREIPKAVYFKRISDDGPAHKAGIQKTDLLVRINHIDFGKVSISNPTYWLIARITDIFGSDGDAASAAEILLKSHRPGDVVPFEVLRANELASVELKLEREFGLLFLVLVGLTLQLLISSLRLLMQRASGQPEKGKDGKPNLRRPLLSFEISYFLLVLINPIIVGFWQLLYLGFLIPFAMLFLLRIEHFPPVIDWILKQLERLVNWLGPLGKIMRSLLYGITSLLNTLWRVLIHALQAFLREPSVILALAITALCWYLIRSAYFQNFPGNEINDFFSIPGLGRKTFESGAIPQVIFATMLFGIIYLGLVCIAEFIFDKRIYERYFWPRIIEQLLRSPDRTIAINLKNQLVEEKENETISRLVWVQWSQEALPALGFLGTVVGIGLAMEGMMGGLKNLPPDIDPLTVILKFLTIRDIYEGFKGLGLAFDTTFLGLVGWLIVGLLQRNVSKRLAKRLSGYDERLDRQILMWGTTSDVGELLEARIFREEIRAIIEHVIWEDRDNKFKSIRDTLFEPVIAFSKINGPGGDASVKFLNNKFGDDAWKFGTLGLANASACCGIISVEKQNANRGLGVIQFHAFDKVDPKMIESNETFAHLLPTNDLRQVLGITAENKIYRLDFEKSETKLLVTPPDFEKIAIDKASVITVSGKDVVVLASKQKLFGYEFGTNGSLFSLHEITREYLWENQFFHGESCSFWATRKHVNEGEGSIVEYRIQKAKDRYIIEPGFDRDLPDSSKVHRLLPITQGRVLMLDKKNLYYLDTQLPRPKKLELPNNLSNAITSTSQLWFGRDNWIAIATTGRLRMWKLRRYRLYSFDQVPALPVPLEPDKIRMSHDGQYLVGHNHNEFFFWEFPKHMIDSL